MEKAWFYETLFFQVVIVMVKDTRSMKVSFMHYRNYIVWTGVQLPDPMLLSCHIPVSE